jgi:hypothetical protein
MEGYKKFCELHNLATRHTYLVEEMFRRGYYGHQTPIEEVLPEFGQVDVDFSLKDLYTRCEECRGRIWHYQPAWVDNWLKNAG